MLQILADPVALLLGDPSQALVATPEAMLAGVALAEESGRGIT